MTLVILGLIVPFVGTILGSAMVFFIKDKLNPLLEKLLTGFAAGVMVAASIWSLILPSMEMSESMGKLSFIPAAVGFVLGMIFLLVFDSILPHLHKNTDAPEGVKSSLKKKELMMFAVTLHNIPEGMAVGVMLAGTLASGANISIGAALVLSIGIAIQNFPEGCVVSLPLAIEGDSKKKAFMLGSMSGIVEPIFGALTILLVSLVTPILPYFLSFAAGAMIYVVIEELIPDSQNGKHSNIGTIGFTVGFVLMMVLDIALG